MDPKPDLFDRKTERLLDQQALRLYMALSSPPSSTRAQKDFSCGAVPGDVREGTDGSEDRRRISRVIGTARRTASE